MGIIITAATARAATTAPHAKNTLHRARDALASGDRVLAENYLQHADHCYRMMVEEGSFRQQQPQRPAQPGDAQPQVSDEQPMIPENTSQLPAFLTANYEAPQQQQSQQVDPNTVQNWEERDA